MIDPVKEIDALLAAAPTAKHLMIDREVLIGLKAAVTSGCAECGKSMPTPKYCYDCGRAKLEHMLKTLFRMH